MKCAVCKEDGKKFSIRHAKKDEGKATCIDCVNKNNEQQFARRQKQYECVVCGNKVNTPIGTTKENRRTNTCSEKCQNFYSKAIVHIRVINKIHPKDKYLADQIFMTTWFKRKLYEHTKNNKGLQESIA